MILQVYAVYDKAVAAYLQPFYARSRGEAIRSFMEACNDEKHKFNGNAADFALMFLGLWDDDSGLFSVDNTTSAGPITVLSALEATADRSERQ